MSQTKINQVQQQYDEINVYTDGGSKGNPGPGSVGVVITDIGGNVVHTHSECIGDCTNNQAEYAGVIAGLKACARLNAKKVHCFSDSQVVVNQMNGKYKTKEPILKQLNQTARQYEKHFANVTYEHLPRTHPYIQQADNLVNEVHYK